MGAFNWLNDAIDRFNYVGNDGAVEGILIPEGEEGNYVRCWEANLGHYLRTPNVLRRCFFLSPNELSVLWELVWRLDENGYGSVSQKTIGKMMNQLMKKGFIQKKRTTATDIIRTCNLSKNPYILVSEGVHYWISFVIGIFLPDQKGKKLESQFDSNVSASLDLVRKVVKQFVGQPRQYQPFIERLQANGDFKDLYVETMRDLQDYLTDAYNAKAFQINGLE